MTPADEPDGGEERRSPYRGLPPRAFWRSAVAEQQPSDIAGLYVPKFPIRRRDRVATAGSCFAQHIARYLRLNGFRVLDTERPPPGLEGEAARRFGFEIYSARFGNVYTVRQLLQLFREAHGKFKPRDIVWSRDGRHFDALRPSVEPQGLRQPASVAIQRREHLAAVRELAATADILIFTLGLTEAWVHAPSGTVYPTAPGTIAGSFDPAVHVFANFTAAEIHADFVALRRLLQRRNPGLRFLLTVSPVALTATASPEHVLVANTYSKSVLRAVAGQLAQEFADVDYFPSYELIATPFSRGAFYEADLRGVTEAGVETVMRVFFAAHGAPEAVAAAADEPETTRNEARRRAKKARAEAVVCEEELLEAFAK